MDNFKNHVVYEYEFHRDTSAAETVRTINDVYMDSILTDWSKKANV